MNVVHSSFNAIAVSIFTTHNSLNINFSPIYAKDNNVSSYLNKASHNF
ncbi:hypothetical protein CRYPD_1314 [uncultured Candidatus Thioglobus sp.]|nr:hypothetical protein CRYPD_1314 [uncultured Candidatus Thioglobus sp.]